MKNAIILLIFSFVFVWAIIHGLNKTLEIRCEVYPTWKICQEFTPAGSASANHSSTKTAK
jgi:hypothetical protein